MLDKAEKKEKRRRINGVAAALGRSEEAQRTHINTRRSAEVRSHMDIGAIAIEASQIARTIDGRMIEMIDTLTRAPAMDFKGTAEELPAEAVAVSDALAELQSALIRYETALYARERDAA